jgi:hypothetical protein
VCVDQDDKHFVLAIVIDKTNRVFVYDSANRLKNWHARSLLEVYFGHYSNKEVVFLTPHASFQQRSGDHTNCGIYVLIMAWFLCGVSISESPDPQHFVEEFSHVALNISVQVSFNTPSFSYTPFSPHQ